MSRSLNPTRPVSRRLILECEARIASPASSSEIRLPSRNRLSWAPSRILSTVGPPTTRGRDQVADRAAVCPCCAHASSRERQANGVNQRSVPWTGAIGLQARPKRDRNAENSLRTGNLPASHPAYLSGPPKSPALAPSRKASHSARVKTRAGPSGNRELRTATSPAGSSAASTQLPLGLLYVLFLHSTQSSSDASYPVIRSIHRQSLHRRVWPRRRIWRRSVQQHLHVHAINGIVTDERALMDAGRYRLESIHGHVVATRCSQGRHSRHRTRDNR